jgi:hypothetical protein
MHWMLRGPRATVALAISMLTLLLTACGTTTSPGANTTATVSPTASTVTVFFTRHPDSDTDPTKVFALTRTTIATSVPGKASAALDELFKGPTADERAQNYYSPFDGQLALQSFCPGEFRTFELTVDHRGPTPEPGTVTVQFCRRVDIPGDLDGPRMAAMVTATVMQFPQFKHLVILNYQGNCFDDLRGANACLSGPDGQPTQTGYPVQVYFSKHPDSDTTPTKLFPVARTSPTLGVATYAMSQLIAGPTAAEQAQGYYTPLQGVLTGGSICNGADFMITLNSNRGHAETGTATLQFCRDVRGFGDTGAAIVRNEISRTLTQFPTIQKVVIIYKDGSCFDDLIGCD